MYYFFFQIVFSKLKYVLTVYQLSLNRHLQISHYSIIYRFKQIRVFFLISLNLIVTLNILQKLQLHFMILLELTLGQVH